MQRLGAQSARIDAIDSKAAAMFTIGSTILPITVGLLSTDQDQIGDCTVALVALCAGFGSYLLLVSLFVRSYRVAKWTSDRTFNN